MIRRALVLLALLLLAAPVAADPTGEWTVRERWLPGKTLKDQPHGTLKISRVGGKLIALPKEDFRG